jgi:hypothetical protein
MGLSMPHSKEVQRKENLIARPCASKLIPSLIRPILVMGGNFKLLKPLVVAGLAFIPAAVFASHRVASPTTSSANDNVEVTATITLSEPDIAHKLGADPGKGIALVEVRVSPKGDEDLRISADDFYLLSHDDGQRSQPFDPGQLAGRGALVVGPGQGQNGGMTAQRYGIPIGTGPDGRMSRMPGNSVGVGSTAGPGTLGTKADDKMAGNQTLLAALKAKQLPDKVTKDEVTGYLYFPLDGKHKLKNLAILYRGPAGHLDLEFEH